jgi:outer membrane protein
LEGRIITFCFLAGVVFLSGCATLNPEGEVSKTPISPSQPFVGRSPVAEGNAWAISQTADELSGRTLTLAECIRIGLERNPQTAGSWEAVRSAAARAGEEKSAYFPEVNFSTSAQTLKSLQRPSADNFFSTGLALNYLLFDGGTRSARVSGARADLEALGYQHNATLRNVALKIEQSYFILLASRWSQQVAEETVRNAQYHVRLAQARFDAGLVPRSDVLKAATEKADADLSLVSAKNAVRIAEGALASAMGLKVSVPIDIADVPESAQTKETEAMEQLLAEATKNRPELLSAVAKVRSKQAGIEEARAQYWPNVSANAGYGWGDDSFPPSQDEWFVGLSLSFPLFTGFKRGYQVERAKTDAEQVKADYVSQLRDVELEVWTAYSKLKEAEETIQAAHAFVASAEESVRLAEAEYKAGTGNIIGLIDAQTALTLARNRLVQARFAWYMARAQFQKSVGRSLTSDTGK